MTFIRNRWYVAAWDGEVAIAPISRTICGEPIVIFHEDVEVLERQQQSIADNPDMPLRVLNIDSGGAHSRRVIERLMQENA